MTTRRGFLAAIGALVASRVWPTPPVWKHRSDPRPRLEHMRMRTGGVVCRYPASIRYLDGI